MLLEYLKEYLSEYEFREGSEENLDGIFELQRENASYFAAIQRHEVTREECRADFTAAPPDFPLERKYYRAVYAQGSCIAILDYLEGYPKEDTVYIGYLMVAKEQQDKGVGRKINEAFMRAARQAGYGKIKLACYRANETGYRFWRRNRYTAEKITERENDGQIYPLIYMECDLTAPEMFLEEEERSTLYRAETPEDYRGSEEMTRRAFWNKYVPGCNEHYVLHCLRGDAAFVPELSMVAEIEGRIAGGIWYSKSTVKTEEAETKVLTFGPLCVAPEYQGTGIGGKLLEKSVRLARQAGYPGIIIMGEPQYYPKYGFVPCEQFGITTADGKNFDAFLGLELRTGGLSALRGGRFFEAEVFERITEAETEEYDKHFAPLEKLKLPDQWQQ